MSFKPRRCLKAGAWSNLAARLNAVERQRWAKPEVLEGAIEIHSMGDLEHLEGELCSEHEACVFRSKPIMGKLRRQYLMRWQEGMADPFELG